MTDVGYDIGVCCKCTNKRPESHILGYLVREVVLDRVLNVNGLDYCKKHIPIKLTKEDYAYLRTRTEQ